ncbi:extracellular catalytic domain type 1 short-chain-length polyhydroxyalkanoate depolymerase [Variovorax ginsengisoli]|uniref:Poly(Hydroxyalkanoate) depolymerase family esterase n=1 Tax=Variovorax ginsengisoli TaxID=363844 RepID=A0ABT9SFU8_9BURK|nr:PHB depolymerase family esterase [Variovorax ginsengisoli]MDP9902252.1 poly(hydroxyalkanoate) depolymerase family esterase [Variovorax ginsengisoli]
MNPLLQSLMQKSALHDRTSALLSATERIQQGLRKAVWQATAHGDPTVTPNPANASVIDVDARVIDDGKARRASEQASVVARGAREEAPAEQAERWAPGQFSHQGRTLAFRLYEPPPVADPSGAPASPKALVLMLHGCTQDAADFAAGTQMNALARTHGVMVLYPEQTAHAHSQKCWNWFKPQHQQRGRGEPALLAALTQSVVARHNVDPSRVYVAGLSAGGAMADIMGRCYPDLFAAVGVHSGLPRGAANDLMSALAAMRGGGAPVAGDPGTSPPLIVFHGDADATVSPVNGTALVQAVLQQPAVQHVTENAQTGISPRGQRFTREIHRRVDGVTAVELWQLHGAGHAWAGGSPQGSFTDPLGVDASAEMLRFFLEHRRSS